MCGSLYLDLNHWVRIFLCRSYRFTDVEQTSVHLASIVCYLPSLVGSSATVILTMGSATAPLGGEESTVSFHVCVHVPNELSTTTKLLNVIECDSLADGEHRTLREEGNSCDCKDGWGGINCNGAYATCISTSRGPIQPPQQCAKGTTHVKASHSPVASSLSTKNQMMINLSI
jgi:hypothetical protein